MKAFFLPLLTCLILPAAGQDDGAVRGVNPADNLTKFEILPKFTPIAGGSDGQRRHTFHLILNQTS